MSRPYVFPAAGLVLALCLPTASAREATTSPGCNVDSPYTLQVDDRGMRLQAHGSATPRQVLIHDGTLVLDGRPQPVTAADARRLREIETGTRALLPDVAAVAREAVHIGFDALGGVHAALGGTPRKAREIEALRERALRRVEQTLGRGEWRPGSEGAAFEAEFAAAAAQIAATAAPTRASWLASTAEDGRLAQRLDAMEAALGRSIALREATLDAHAATLCAGLDRLHRLQERLELRLADGRPLRLFEFERDGVQDPGTQPPTGRDPARTD